MSSNFELIKKAAAQKRIAHLLLIYGSGIDERRHAALELASILNCQEAIYQCGNCPVCKKIKTGNHPDVAVVRSSKQSIGIELIKSLQEMIFRQHFEATFKVYIIEEADKLTLPAANALLKIAEDPPKATIIILCTANSEGIIPTLHSRSQLVFLPAPTIEEWPYTNDQGREEEIEDIFRLSGGDPDLAKSIQEKGIDLVKRWLEVYIEAVESEDYLKIFPLSPLEREESLIFLQTLAVVMTQKIKQGQASPLILTAIQQATQAIKKQANHRLAIEVLALKHIRTGGAELG